MLTPEVKSVITAWAYDGQFVWGYEPSTDKSIRTSTIKRIWLNDDGRIIAETQNSLYELKGL
jgi:outer membrane lipoprotein-sorting protein